MKIHVTPRAAALMGAEQETLKSKMLDDLLKDHPEPAEFTASKLVFHTMEHGPYEYIMVPHENGEDLLIDSCTRRESEPLKAGPFKGKKVIMPEPDSHD